ncbi:hypothetical protein D3C73_1025730 [compost metagenome]
MPIEGFSGNTTLTGITSATTFSGWDVTDPYYTSASFNAVTGEYIIPTTGRYLIEAIINFETAAPIAISLGAGVDPEFVVTRTAPVVTDLLSGLLPVLNVNVALLTLRAVLGNGSVTISGEVELTAGDSIELQYVDDGLTLALDFQAYWSINQVS